MLQSGRLPPCRYPLPLESFVLVLLLHHFGLRRLGLDVNRLLLRRRHEHVGRYVSGEILLGLGPLHLLHLLQHLLLTHSGGRRQSELSAVLQVFKETDRQDMSGSSLEMLIH